MSRVILADGAIDLRLGRWQDVLADVETCDSVVTDPPYSARTHEGSDAVQSRYGNAIGANYDGAERHEIGYAPFTGDDVREVCSRWLAAAKSWALFFCDDVLAPSYRGAASAAGRVDFAPVSVLQHKPRLAGDGPAPGAVYFMPSRPRERRFLSWGSLPGWYEATPERGTGVMGAKPLALMRAIVRDYTRPGDLVVDPFCGSGTTALAAAIEGRRCITSEMDPETFAKARKRLERGFTPSMFGSPKVRAKQGSLV